jgi:prefoldin alpha subunit
MQDDNKSLADAQAQLRYLQNVYSQQFELLENEIATFSLAMNSVQRNLELLHNKNRLEKSKALINGDGGLYIEASISPLERVIMYVGAGYLVEKSPEEAKEFLQSNAKKQEEAAKKLTAERQKIEKQLFDIAYQLSILEQQEARG